MTSTPQSNQQDQQQKNQPDTRASGFQNTQGSQNKGGFDPSRQARPQDEDNENEKKGGACSSDKDKNNDPYKKPGQY